MDWKPDYFIWLGDAIYADRMYLPLLYTPSSRELWASKYRSLLQQQAYLRLKASVPILGTWDDHDFGENNAGKDFKHKALSRELFLDFLGEPSDSPRRTDEGIQVSYDITELDKTTRIILLDGRSFLDKKQRLTIGQSQMKWLKEQLAKPADAYLIMNGVQFLMQDRLLSWSESFSPTELNELLEFINGKQGVILASGDVHFGEIIAYPCLEQVLYEITSSGLTHSVQSQFGFLGCALVKYWHPWTFNAGRRVNVKHWGSIQIDFASPEVKTTLALRDSSGKVLDQQIFGLYEKVNGGRSGLCSESPLKRALKHYASVWLVFGLPLISFTITALVFLRKISHSY